MKASAEFLLVDDDPVFTGAMQRGLERRGYRVRCSRQCGCGAAGLS
jgi:ActR/RegA family two-component response regulator